MATTNTYVHLKVDDKVSTERKNHGCVAGDYFVLHLGDGVSVFIPDLDTLRRIERSLGDIQAVRGYQEVSA